MCIKMLSYIHNSTHICIYLYLYNIHTLFDLRPFLCSHCNIVQHTSTRCNTLQLPQHSATLCNTLQHIATHCNKLNHTCTSSSSRVFSSKAAAARSFATASNSRVCQLHCSKLQLAATQCNTSTHCNTQTTVLSSRVYQLSSALQKLQQHTATHCNTRIHFNTHTHKRNCLEFVHLSIVLHHTATHCCILPCTYINTATYCNSLQLTATHCNSLHHAAASCNAPTTR